MLCTDCFPTTKRKNKMRWEKDFPYLYMSKEELFNIPNDTLKQLVRDFIHNPLPKDCFDAYVRQGCRLQEEMLRRQEQGFMEPPASWTKHKAEQEDIANWSFSKVMELPDTDPRLLKYLKLHHKKWKAEKEDNKIETLKDKIVDGLTDGVCSQDYTQLVSSELDKELEKGDI